MLWTCDVIGRFLTSLLAAELENRHRLNSHYRRRDQTRWFRWQCESGIIFFVLLIYLTCGMYMFRCDSWGVDKRRWRLDSSSGGGGQQQQQQQSVRATAGPDRVYTGRASRQCRRVQCAWSSGTESYRWRALLGTRLTTLSTHSTWHTCQSQHCTGHRPAYVQRCRMKFSINY